MNDLSEDDTIEIIKIGSKVKENLVKEAKREAATNILATLRAIVLEQKSQNLIDKEEADYILDAVFDMCLRNGYIE